MRIKNIFKIAIIFIMTMFIMIQTSIASTTGVITYDTVRVRKDPEPDLKKTKTYALVSIGDKVEVLEKSGNWYKITCTYEGKKVTGYVREDLIDVKNPEKLETSSNNNSNSNNNSSNSNSSTNTNTNTTTNSNANSSTSSNTSKPDTSNNSSTNSNSTTEKPTTSEQNTSNEETSNNESNNPNESSNNSNKPTTSDNQNQSEVILTTLNISESDIKEGNKIKLEKDTHIKILPVVNSTNIGTITSGTEVTVVENVNKWIKIETEELIGWARIE